jgi:hypothetical protein
VFTEHGAVMLANVLSSPVAVRASIQLARAFVRLRQMLATHEELARKIETVERKVGRHGADLQSILAMLRKVLAPQEAEPPRRPIGIISPEKKK